MAFGKKNHVKLDPLSYNILLLGESKVGKEQPVSEPVLTTDGWKPMGDIKVGMQVFGDDGKPHNVIGVFPQGEKDIYEVTFRDGTKTRCGLEHIWTVSSQKQRENMRKYGDNRTMDLTLKEILENKYKKWIIDPKRSNGGSFCYKYSVPINKAIEFKDDTKFDVSPYALGLLLGDGGFTGNIITFTNAENDLFDELSEELKPLNVELRYRNFENHKQANICNIDKSDYYNRLITCIKELGLYKKDSRYKFIPKEYIYTSVENRLAILSGIINTDGSVTDDGKRIVISTYSKQFAQDIAEISRSLGFISSISEYNRTDSESTKKYEFEYEYRISVISSDYSMLHLSKKHSSKIKNKQIDYVKSITNIQYVGKEEAQCIMVDNPSQLYITNDYIVTHNTTLIKKVCEKLVGEEGYLFLEIGQERGADAIEGISYINCPKWSMDYDEYSNSAGFIDVCEDIITNKNKEYPNLRVVVWDTYDQLITVAEQEAIRLWNKECREKNQPDKIAKSINASWGGFGRGEKKSMELMFDVMAQLRSVGVSTIVIGHVKNKEVSDVVTGETYSILTSDQQSNYFNALKKNLHFLGLAYIDRTIVKKKTGRKNMVTKKDEVIGKVSEETRRIKFRDDNYAVDSGSRFANIVPEIEMNADAFIKALTDAIESERSKSGRTIEESLAEENAIAKAKEEQVKEKEKKNSEEVELKSIISDIVSFFTNNKTNVSIIKPVLEKCKELGYSNPKEITNINDAKTILAMTLN